ncbi:hypothetical protein PMIN07_005248 [Paraphaeosphaeria minitans]
MRGHNSGPERPMRDESLEALRLEASPFKDDFLSSMAMSGKKKKKRSGNIENDGCPIKDFDDSRHVSNSAVGTTNTVRPIRKRAGLLAFHLRETPAKGHGLKHLFPLELGLRVG